MASALLQALIFIVSIKRHFGVAFVVMSTSENSYDISSHWPLSSLGIDPLTIFQYRFRRCKYSNLVLDFDYLCGRFSWGLFSSLKKQLTPLLAISIASKSFLIILYFSSKLCSCGRRREANWRKSALSPRQL